MNLLLKRILGASLTLSAFSFVNPTPANAQSCAVAPTCESLGYTKSESDCGSQDILRCPLDTSKVICLSSQSSEKCENPAMGDILYSDMSCSSEVISEKTPIGIIFSSHKAIALSSEEKKWSQEEFYMPKIIDTEDIDSDCFGERNTLLFMEFCQGNDISCPAIEYAYNYKTPGTKAGDWYIPAMAETAKFMDSRSLLNQKLSLVGGEKIPGAYHFSSSYCKFYGQASVYYYRDDYNNAINVGSSARVRPVIKF